VQNVILNTVGRNSERACFNSLRGELFYLPADNYSLGVLLRNTGEKNRERDFD